MDKARLAQSFETATDTDVEWPGSTNNKSSQPLAFNSLTSKQISLELERFTEETQKLQEELGNVTKLTCGAHANYVLSAAGGRLDELAPTVATHQSLGISNQQAMGRRLSNSDRNFEFENTLDECINQLINLEMNKMRTYGYQDQLKDATVDERTKLQKVEMNRLKDSRDHMEKMEKMLHLLEEVQETKRFGDQRLQKTEEEVLILKKKIKSLEKVSEDCHRLCSAQCLHNSTTDKTIEEIRLLNVPVQRDFNKESEVQHNENHQLPRCSLNQECVEGNKEERRRIEKQLLLPESQVIELKKTLSSQEKKVCSEHQQYRLQEDVKALRGQLMMTWEQLRRTEEEKTYLQGLFDQSIQETQKSQELLAEKKMELEQQESQQHMVSVGECRQQVAQYSGTSHNLHQENVFSDQLNACRQEILHLKMV